MSEQPEALLLADWLDGTSNGPMDVRHKSAAELRRLHELAESEGRWASEYLKRAVKAEERIAELEAALGQVQKPVAWIYSEGLQPLKSGKPWVAYGTEGDRRIPLFLNNDAVAPRVEPPVSESGAGFESLPASPKWQGLTDNELHKMRHLHDPTAEWTIYNFARAIEAALREKNS